MKHGSSCTQWRSPLTAKILPKIRKKREKIRKNWEKEGKRGKFRKISGRKAKIGKVLSLCPYTGRWADYASGCTSFLARVTMLMLMHKNIPVILLVNTSRDIKYYAYIPNIWSEGKSSYKNGYIPRLRDIVGILPISPMPTLCDHRGVCLCLFSLTVTKTFDANCINW